MHLSLGGVFPVLSTPFREDDTVDQDDLAREIEWLIGSGVHGVTIAMVSEVLRLDTCERIRLTETVCELVAGRVPVVASAGAESTAVAVQLGQEAERAGAAAVMAIPPVTVALPDASISSYYARILESVAIPVIVQDASGYLGQPMSLQLQADLLQKYGAARVYFKPEAHPIGPRLTGLQELTGGTARVFEGTGGLALVDSFKRGIVGTMPGPEVPWAIVALWSALQADDLERATRIHAPLAALVSMQSTLESFIAVEKHLLVHQGVFTADRSREPVGFRLDDGTRDEVERLMAVLAAAVGHRPAQPDGGTTS
jgi:4-hydroxy-tetrahydrodipicolinate synthase